jgi:beta-mannosidase
MSSSAEPPGRRARPATTQILPVTAWQVVRAEPGAEMPVDGWRPARRPGFVDDPAPDDADWWWRTALPATDASDAAELVLELDGVTPPAVVLVDDVAVATVASMFRPLQVPLPPGAGTLTIHCRSVAQELSGRRTPRARWRTAVVDNRLRFLRTSFLGRAAFAPGPPPAGPWRAARVAQHRGVVIDRLRLLPTVDGATGCLDISAAVRPLAGHEVLQVSAMLVGPDPAAGPVTARLQHVGDRWVGTVVVDDVMRWWPHTHGDPHRYSVSLEVELDGPGDVTPVAVDAGHVGFRSIHADPSGDDGLTLHVNDVAVFVRGAVWTRPGGLGGDDAAAGAALRTAAAAGLNLIRIAGTTSYETATLLDRCDELGVLLWQDAMLANLDYPASDPEWLATFSDETAVALAELTGRASFVVWCGGSEVEQQVAMLGQDPAPARAPLLDETLPQLLRDSGADAVWVPNSPSGGDLPFRTDRGVAHYFGVGGYRRPLGDARAAAVRFASECLAVSNIPDDAALSEFGADASAWLACGAWQAGVPKDNGTDWDFADVRDHYLAALYDVDPGALRATDPERYVHLSRVVSGDVMAAVFGEWRRAASPCGGGIVLLLTDLLPGAGWGLLDHTGRPKAVLRRLATVLAPCAVWLTDEGLNGVHVHVANDRPQPLATTLELSLHRADGLAVGTGSIALDLSAHGHWSGSVEALTGGFADVSWAYRFGPPGVTAVVARLGPPAAPTGRACLVPEGVRPARGTAADLGLEVSATVAGAAVVARVRSQALVTGLCVSGAGLEVADAAFVPPGGGETLELCLPAQAAVPATVTVRAANLDGPLVVPVGGGT